MLRNILYLVIVLSGIGLMQYRFFGDAHFPPVISKDTTYQRIKGELISFTYQLESLTAKLFTGHSTKESSAETNQSPEPPVEQKTVDRTILNSDNILYYTNIERTKRGLKPLKFNAKLTRSATAKNKDMFEYQYFAHTSPFDSKKTFAYFVDNESYEFTRTSENLASGDFTTAQQVVTAWMNSPNHRANILFPEYRDIGASVRSGNLNGVKTVMIVQHFGIPKSACPPVSQTMLDSIQLIEEKANLAKDEAMKLEKSINDPQNISGMNVTTLDDLIGTYNTAIRTYNEFVTKLKTMSAEYNDQVKKYDDCIKDLN